VLIKNLGVAVRRIYAPEKRELATIASEFVFPESGTVADTQRSFTTLVSTGSLLAAAWKRLSQLQELYTSRAPSLNRHESPPIRAIWIFLDIAGISCSGRFATYRRTNPGARQEASVVKDQRRHRLFMSVDTNNHLTSPAFSPGAYA